MKKIKLEELNLEEFQVLNRSQLKSMVGGSGAPCHGQLCGGTNYGCCPEPSVCSNASPGEYYCAHI